MKSTLIIALLLPFCAIAKVQNKPFEGLAKLSTAIVRATVVEQGRRVRMEEGIIHCNARLLVNETFKGTLSTGDTIDLRYVEFTLDLGGKLQSTPMDTTQYLPVGKTMIFLLKPDTDFEMHPGKTYRPVDDVLGVLEPSPHLELYLILFLQK